MKLIVHDLSRQAFEELGIPTNTDTIIVSDNNTIKSCIGCFGCWTKTPGICVLRDNYNYMGELLAKCDELVVISRCVYGSYSPFIRNVWDRSIPYILPYFKTNNDETHHKQRYKKRIAYAVHFYSEDIIESEIKTAKALVQANAMNFYLDVSKVCFHKNLQDMRGAVQ